MAMFLGIVHSVSPSLAAMLVASVWQGLLLVVGVAGALRLLRGVSPSARTWVWTGVLGMVLVLPVLALAVPHGVAEKHGELHLPSAWSVAMLAVWAVCSGWRAVVLVRSAVRLWRLAGRAVPVRVDGSVAALLASPRRAVLCVTVEVNRPSVAGFLRPRVLLPSGLLETLSTAELEHVVRHEMEHLRRWDDWLNLLQQVGLVLLPLNPVMLWLDRRLSRERELACDDGVLRATRASKAYAACLVKLAEDSLRRKGLALALSVIGTRARESELMRRVRRILASPERVGSAGRGRLAVGGLVVGVLVAAGLLVRSPEWVSFDGGSQVMAQVAPVPVGQFADPGVRRSVAPAWPSAHAVQASMRVTPLALSRPAMAVAVQRRKVRVRTVPAVAPAMRTWRPVPVKAEVEVAPVVPRLLSAAQTDEVPAPRVVMTTFSVSQSGFVSTWAAVPVRDGWLIVPL